ncbi:MAG: hypothetical protein NE330_14415 [Lentisphaeraceae bacterium]|nr:hypothetical protein [Lentisphaeraceae bacterium]
MNVFIKRFFIFISSLLLVTSCKEGGQVRTIDVQLDKVEVAQKAETKMKGLPEGTNLILGMVIPTSSSQWFVKLAGPSSEFNEAKGLLDKIIETIDFDDYSVEVVKLEVPEGWVQTREKGFLHSSITKEGMITRVTISKASGTVLDNVNRWNRQLGNGPIDQRQLMQLSKTQTINGRFGILVVLAKHDGSAANQLQQPVDPHAGHDHAKNPHAKDPHAGHDHAKNPHGAMPAAKGIRIAFADVNGQTWYIKLMGDANVLIKEKANFEAFVKSFSYEGNNAKWQTPQGWKELGGSGMVKASFDVSGAKATIVNLPAGSGDLVSNVNRWRRQIGLSAAGPVDIEKSMQKIEVGPTKYTYLFLTKAAEATKTPAPQTPAKDGVNTQSGISFELPEGWSLVDPSGMRKVNLKAGDISITGISLGEAAKGLAKNVERWSGQVGMTNPTADQLKQISEKVSFSGAEADYVLLKGKEQSILAVIYEQGSTIWFFKATGSTADIVKQVDNFKAFVKSIKLPGGTQ